MTDQRVVASANILRDLGAADARRALGAVLARDPDVVGLQEWEFWRVGILRELGPTRVWPRPGVTLPAKAGADARYAWAAPVLGGCAVGWRADRLALAGWRSVLLTGLGRADKPGRPLGLEPPRVATLVVLRDRRRPGRSVALVDYHLVSAVQRGGEYRRDRPQVVARHRREVAAIEDLVARLLDVGHETYAVGDSNFDGLRLARLTSCWEGRADAAATHGSRAIDDVHGPGPARAVETIESASDHRAVVATRGLQ